jgi:hypothetical protein
MRAPKKFLTWVREQNENILDELPVEPKFKGRKITKFLLNEASKDLIESILDVRLYYGPKDSSSLPLSLEFASKLALHYLF